MNQRMRDFAHAKGLVKTKIVKVLYEATIMRLGSKFDNKGWIVQCLDGSIKALTTDYGSICQWSGKEMHEQLELHKLAVAELEEAIQFMVNK